MQPLISTISYQVALVGRPHGWEPDSPDDVPSEPSGPLQIVSESEDLFAAVREAIEHNERALGEDADRWAVVVEPGSLGQIWPAARLCTPISYKVTSIWWPDGWEPNSPLDVPNCVRQAQSQAGRQRLSYEKAVGTVNSLNRQCMDQPGTTWYVVVAVENESVSRTVSYDPAGTETTVEVRRLHVVRPEPGGRGDCSHCPAHSFQCAKAQWNSQAQTVTSTRSRSVGDRHD